MQATTMSGRRLLLSRPAVSQHSHSPTMHRCHRQHRHRSTAQEVAVRTPNKATGRGAVAARRPGACTCHHPLEMPARPMRPPRLLRPFQRQGSTVTGSRNHSPLTGMNSVAISSQAARTSGAAMWQHTQRQQRQSLLATRRFQTIRLPRITAYLQRMATSFRGYHLHRNWRRCTAAACNRCRWQPVPAAPLSRQCCSRRLSSSSFRRSGNASRRCSLATGSCLMRHMVPYPLHRLTTTSSTSRRRRKRRQAPLLTSRSFTNSSCSPISNSNRSSTRSSSSRSPILPCRLA